MPYRNGRPEQISYFDEARAPKRPRPPWSMAGGGDGGFTQIWMAFSDRDKRGMSKGWRGVAKEGTNGVTSEWGYCRYAVPRLAR